MTLVTVFLKKTGIESFLTKKPNHTGVCLLGYKSSCIMGFLPLPVGKRAILVGGNGEKGFGVGTTLFVVDGFH